MQDSTFQRAPVKVLVDSLDANSIIVNGNVVTINAGGIHITFDKTTDLVSSYKDCNRSGTKQTVSIVLTFDATCNCEQCFDLHLVTTVMGSRSISDTYPQVRYYSACLPKGTAVNDGNFDTFVGPGLVEQINADTYAPATAAYNAGTNTLTLTAKANGVGVFRVAPMNGTIVNTPGTGDFLTTTDMFKLFPLKPERFGQNPAGSIPSGTDYCVYYFNLIYANASNDPVEGGVEGRNVEYIFYVNNNNAGFKTQWDTELVGAITALNTAAFCNPAVGTIVGSVTTGAAFSAIPEFAALSAMGLELVSVVVDDVANNLGINPAVTLTAAQVAASTVVVTTDTSGTVDVVITTKECNNTIHAQAVVIPSGTFNLLVV